MTESRRGSVSFAADDPSADVIDAQTHPLKAVFAPKAVAVIGATDRPGSVGRTLLKNLIDTPFGGAVYPVHPSKPHILGVRACASISEVPEPVDLAVIITPAKTVPGLMRQCADAGVKSAIIISAGFREVGPEGAKLEEEVLKEARRGGVRVVGPNCLGAMCPCTGVNASFANLMPAAGNVAFVSQSGAMITSVLDWSVQVRVGFSAVVSVGAMLDVDFSDIIDYLGSDPNTKSILLYIETIGDARRFLAAAREVARRKPIILIKAGRTEAAAKAAASHTGALTGSDTVLDAAFRRAGVLRVDLMEELFEMAEVLAKQPIPNGNRLAIVTNAGGPGVLSCDALARFGGELAELAPETMKELDAVLPAAWSHANPVDILGDASSELYAKSLEIVARDPNTDGLLVVLTPQSVTAPTACAEALRPYAECTGKPVLASWMGGADVKGGVEVLSHAKIPTYAYPDRATRAFNYMHEYRSNLRTLYECCSLEPESELENRQRNRALDLIRRVLAEGRTLMTEAESKELLRAYGIPVTPCTVATSAKEAAKAAEEMGFPVVLKLHSTTITHKTDVGGVKLNLQDGPAVEAAFEAMQESVSRLADPAGFEGATVQPMVSLKGHEVIVGSSMDPQFGPVMLFGLGGSMVEVFKDSAVGLPPLTMNLAKGLLEGTKIYKALQGVRGAKSVDIPELQRIMVKFSQMLVDLPWLKECDINPLIASPDGILALDSRVLLHPPETPEEQLPKPAIRPYPSQYISNLTLADGAEVKMRPIRPEDEDLMVDFYASVSDQNLSARYGHRVSSIEMTKHSKLMRICFADYEHAIVMVALVPAGEELAAKGKSHVIVAAGRITKSHMTGESKVALLVTDAWQHRGLGDKFLAELVDIGRREGAPRLHASVLPENEAALRLLRKHGFEATEQKPTQTLLDLTREMAAVA